MNFLRFSNAQNGDEKHSVSNSYESKQQLSLAQQKQQNKDTKELLQSLVTTSLTQKKNKNKQQVKTWVISQKCFSLMPLS